jgi:hypothetical protein
MPPAEKRRRLSVTQQNGAHNLPPPPPFSSSSSGASNPPHLPTPSTSTTAQTRPPLSSGGSGAGRATLAAGAQQQQGRAGTRQREGTPSPPVSPLLGGPTSSNGTGGQFDVPPTSTGGFSGFSVGSETYGSSAGTGASGLGIEGAVGRGRESRPRLASRHSNETVSSSAIPGPGDEIRLDGYRDGLFFFSSLLTLGLAECLSLPQYKCYPSTTTTSSPVERSAPLEATNESLSSSRCRRNRRSQRNSRRRRLCCQG